MTVEIGQLLPETRYWIGVRAIDECNDASPIAVTEVQTTPIHFTTVSPCFVATAAWGTPLAGEIGALRRFRDRHLATNAPGRALVGFYYEHGPAAAEAVAASPVLAAATRAVLGALVELLGDDEPL